MWAVSGAVSRAASLVRRLVPDRIGLTLVYSPRLHVAAVPAMSAQEELDLATVTADLEAALERARRLLRSRDERRSGVCWRPACSAG